MLLRALLIDRDLTNRRNLNRILAARHFECCEAGDLIEALGFASRDGIDLIVASHGAQRSGEVRLSALLQAGAFGENPPPLIVLADPFDAAADPAHEAGTTPLLVPRPLTEDQLAAAIEVAFA